MKDSLKLSSALNINVTRAVTFFLFLFILKPCTPTTDPFENEANIVSKILHSFAHKPKHHLKRARNTFSSSLLSLSARLLTLLSPQFESDFPLFFRCQCNSIQNTIVPHHFYDLVPFILYCLLM